jgi:hypothetical protein
MSVRMPQTISRLAAIASSLRPLTVAVSSISMLPPVSGRAALRPTRPPCRGTRSIIPCLGGGAPHAVAVEQAQFGLELLIRQMRVRAVRRLLVSRSDQRRLLRTAEATISQPGGGLNPGSRTLALIAKDGEHVIDEFLPVPSLLADPAHETLRPAPGAREASSSTSPGKKRQSSSLPSTPSASASSSINGRPAIPPRTRAPRPDGLVAGAPLAPRRSVRSRHADCADEAANLRLLARRPSGKRFGHGSSVTARGW